MSFLTCFCDLPQNEHFSRSPPSPIRATYVLPALIGRNAGPGLRTVLPRGSSLAPREGPGRCVLCTLTLPAAWAYSDPQNGCVRGLPVNLGQPGPRTACARSSPD